MDDEETRSLLASVVEVPESSYDQPSKTRLRWMALRSLIQPSYPRNLQLTAHIRKALAAALESAPDVDVVCVEHNEMAPLIPHQRKNRWALTMHHLHSQMMGHRQDLTQNPLRRWLLGRYKEQALAQERLAASAFDLVFVCSEQDAAVIGPQAVVIPNGVDCLRFMPAPLPSSPSLVITGSLGMPPNIEGITWFCDSVLPIVAKTVPNVTLAVVGRHPAPEIHRLASVPQVTIHTDVPTTVPYLHEARIAVVPIRIGSGTRLKALEAMAAGRPVVGTRVGLEGLGIANREHALVADTESDMASAIIELIQDESLAQRVATAARRLVENEFCWDQIGKDFVEAFLGDHSSTEDARKAEPSLA